MAASRKPCAGRIFVCKRAVNNFADIERRCSVSRAAGGDARSTPINWWLRDSEIH